MIAIILSESMTLAN